MATSPTPLALLIDGKLLRIRIANVFADRANIVSPGGTIELTCTAGMGPAKDKNKAIVKVELKTVGKAKPTTTGELQTDFTVRVECRGTYEWPYEVQMTNFESVDVRNVICQPVYTAALARVRDLLAGIGVNNVQLPYDIRGASDIVEEDDVEVKTLGKKLAIDKKDNSTKTLTKGRKATPVKAAIK